MAEAIYGMNYSNFIGVDRSSDPRVVARNRLAYSVNMWRDYESEQGAAVETFPGFRKILGIPDDKINGMWGFKGVSSGDVKSNTMYIIVHAGTNIYAFPESDARNGLCLGKVDEYRKAVTINNNPSTAFVSNNRLYILDGSHLVEVYQSEKSNVLAKVKIYADGTYNSSYVPTTYYNGQPYEQRNGFTDKVYQIDTSGGKEANLGSREFDLLEKFTPSKNEGGVTEHGIITVYVDDINIEELTITKNVDGIPEPVTEKGNFSVLFREYEDDASIIIPYAISIDPKWIYDSKSKKYKTVKIERKIDATKFNTIGNLMHFQNDKVTMAEAILGCTKSAVYDGRVFLTGNPELPNTVFYSQRNLTGANDPTYFGVYNYFNDGDGNTPNVDMLAMPNMLMVIKGDTVQDGSIYYHVGADHSPDTDKSVRDLVPRIYPSSTGAAGLGSAGLTDAYSLSCNFLDDPVFLSRRGLEGVTKEQLNAERTVQHRSSTIDRLLIQEDLAHASLAEWKGYLVVCCNGHIYLADSRTRTQNAYGSYQYEWFYLEGVGTYENYEIVCRKVTEWPVVDGVSLQDIFLEKGISLWDDEGIISGVPNQDSTIGSFEGIFHQKINNLDVYTHRVYEHYEIVSEKLLEIVYDEKKGSGNFYGAKRVLAVGELLFFATDYDICVFNTDKRGEQIYLKDDKGKDVFDEKGKRILVREVDGDKIDSSWYSFNGVPYISGCSIRLDDCEKKTVTKANVYGTTVARFKMIPGSKCTVKSSINGVNWKKIGEAYISRFNFEDFRFDNTAFTENEDGVFVFPEASRGWVSKQYYFYSDGFCEPFGLYELSYNYRIVGKIRR